MDDDYELMVSNWVKNKLEKFHNVEILEVEEACFNMFGIPLINTREKHKTIPPTSWFVSHTIDGRIL